MIPLHYTGHPLFDVGLAAITALAEKDDPADLTWDDLNKVADYIETYYTEQPLSSFLTVSLMNSDFTQPAFKDNPDRKRAYAHRVARSFGSDIPKGEEICVFTGEPALGLPLSLKQGKDELPPGRAYRQHIPLITGEGYINFSPWGDPGLPVSGEALLCLQFFPMGCRKCSGKLLAVHSDNPQILLDFAREALYENQKAITQTKIVGEIKLPDAPATAQTLLISTLLELDREQRDKRKESKPYSITAYHLTNSGQTTALDEKNPPLKIYHLPLDIVDFLLMLNHPNYEKAWKELVKRGWELSKPSKKMQKEEQNAALSSQEYRRNYLYEDIFRLPENARSFIRMYFLRMPKHNSTPLDPRRDYNLHQDVDLVSWQLTDLLLRKVMHMDKERIEEIRKLGDRLASYVKEQNDKRFFHNFYEAQRGDDFRTILIRANKRHTLAGHDPLFGLDSYCTVFFEQDGDALKPDWKFARDLVLIRMIESLHANNNWLREHPDVLPEDKELDITSSDNE